MPMPVLVKEASKPLSRKQSQSVVPERKPNPRLKVAQQGLRSPHSLNQLIQVDKNAIDPRS
jgi:hypothetical protein